MDSYLLLIPNFKTYSFYIGSQHSAHYKRLINFLRARTIIMSGVLKTYFLPRIFTNDSAFLLYYFVNPNS